MDKKGNRILGIIGAFVGGFIGVLPWIITYVYGNVMFLAFALLIAFVTLEGYLFCDGVKDKYLKVTVFASSIFTVTVTTFLLVPFAMLYKEKIGVSWYNFQVLYSDCEFITIMIQNYIIALFFTVLGVYLILPLMKKNTMSNQKRVKEKDKNLNAIETKKTEPKEKDPKKNPVKQASPYKKKSPTSKSDSSKKKPLKNHTTKNQGKKPVKKQTKKAKGTE